MTTIVLTVHIMIAAALVAVVLLQRSEGGGLGIGGSQGGGFMTARGTANVLTRLTTLLAAAFFATSVILAILAGGSATAPSVLDEVIQDDLEAPALPDAPSVPADQ